ncbi:MAG: chorismate mutase [Proteobacteria bacterium]|nr:chorismate mutase [Pseudomonadota bacterium]
MPTKGALDELRQQIDRIDDQIHDLLIERAALAGQVASAKGGRSSMWRPQREVQILRRLVRRHRGAFPRAAVVRIWHEIMGAMLTLEGRFSVAVCAAPDRPGFWDLARDHFGTIVTMTPFQGAGAVMRAVTDDANVVGVLPWPRDGETDPWWPYLMGGAARAPRIVARLPVGGGEPATSAVAVARAAAEPTGDDRSFLCIEASDEISRTRLMSRLSAAGCDVGFIATHRDRADQPASLHLVEVAGFIGPDDAKLAAIRGSAPDAIRRAQWLGAYAVPLGDPTPAKPPAKT